MLNQRERIVIECNSCSISLIIVETQEQTGTDLIIEIF